MGTSLLRIFCKIISLLLSILSYLCADERPVLGYDVMILSNLLPFSTPHDALIRSIQLLLAKPKSSSIYVGVSFFAGSPTLHSN